MRAEAAKKRWDDCAILAERLEIDKFKVHNYLYKEIKDAGLLEGSLEGDPEIIEQVKNLNGWIRLNEVKIHEPTSQDIQNRDYLKLTLWYIEKIGGIENAKKYLGAAESALEKLR